MGRSLFVLSASGVVLAAAVAAQQLPRSSPQHPTFRAGAMLVTVDAYPTRDGRLVPSLSAEDFDIRENGAPQKVEFVEFIEVPPNANDDERRDPGSQEEADRLAGDPRHRAFVAYFDPYHLTAEAARNMRVPAIEFLERVIGPTDYFAAMNPDASVKDLIFGQRLETVSQEIDRYWPVAAAVEGNGDQNSAPAPITAHEQWLEDCYVGRGSLVVNRLFGLSRLDRLMTSLEELDARLAAIRDARTNVLLFSDGWTPRGPDDSLRQYLWNEPTRPGVVGGRLQPRAHPIGTPDPQACDAELFRLSVIDFAQRFRDLLDGARRANVAFTAIDPGGLAASPGDRGPNPRLDTLRVLAANTDGVAIVDTNDLRTPLRQLADDLSSYYLLGYYTTNKTLDGKYRKIEVSMRPPGLRVTARAGYRMPTDSELRAEENTAARAAARAPAGPSPVDFALDALGRFDAPSQMFVAGTASHRELTLVAELSPEELTRSPNGGDVRVAVNGVGVGSGATTARLGPGTRSVLVRIPLEAAAAGPWHARIDLVGANDSLSGEVTVARTEGPLLGEPILFRAAPSPRSPLQPVADRRFRRTERVHLEWPVLTPIDGREARLLDRAGHPLALNVTLAERAATDAPILAADLALAPLAPGDYVIEVTAHGGADRQRALFAIRVER